MYTAMILPRLIRLFSRLVGMLLFICYATCCFAEKCINAGDCKINVSFTGTYMEETCAVNINNASSA